MPEVTHQAVISHVDRKMDMCILTFGFKRTELWVSLKTNHILKWGICELCFMEIGMKKIRGQPWGLE